MTAVAIQANKIVSNALKTAKHYQSHCTEKTKMNFLAHPIYWSKVDPTLRYVEQGTWWLIYNYMSFADGFDILQNTPSAYFFLLLSSEPTCTSQLATILPGEPSSPHPLCQIFLLYLWSLAWDNLGITRITEYSPHRHGISKQTCFQELLKIKLVTKLSRTKTLQLASVTLVSMR